MSYETWWIIHVYTYIAVAASFMHQVVNGQMFIGHPLNRAYWTGLYVLMAFAIVYCRIGVPLVRSLKVNLKVERVIVEGPGVISVIMKGRKLHKLEAEGGQFFSWRFMTRGHALMSHPYSLSAAPTENYLRITVKNLGDHSKSLAYLKKGTRVFFEGPYGAFTAGRATKKHIVLVGGGVGITPMMSIVRYLTDRDWQGDIYLFIVARTEQDIIFREEIELLQQRHHQLHVCITLTRLEPTSNWRGERGRANVSMLKRFVPDVTCVPVYLCGPESMMDATKETLLSMGVPSSSIKTEAFVSPGVSSASPKFSSSAALSESSGSEDDSDAGSFAVNFAISGKQITTSSQETLLESAETFGIELPFE
jgi:ferredoxin-NADP reductase